MKKLFKLDPKPLTAFLIMLFLLTNCDNRSDKSLKYVDPDIGGVGLLLQPTRPTVQVPNQMIRMYPVRKDYIDDQIRYFPLSLISHRNGEIFGIMPFTSGDSNKLPVSSWDSQLEITTPFFYSTWLENFNTTVEFAPGSKSGVFRITFPEGSPRNIYLRIVQKGKWEMKSPSILTAEEEFKGMKAFVYAVLNQNGKWKKGLNASGTDGIVDLSESQSPVVEFRYGLSFISPEQAKKNLEDQISVRSFEEVKQNAMKLWEERMGQIEVSGGTDSRKRTFYTALYRCYERMVDITEDGKYYSNYDGKIHEAKRNFFVDDWIWDTYLAHHPLRSILQPDLEADMIDSYLRMYDQSGWLPTFPLLFGDNPAMNGFHSTIMILDAWRRGIRNFDLTNAYEAMKKNATEATMLPWRNGPNTCLRYFSCERSPRKTRCDRPRLARLYRIG